MVVDADIADVVGDLHTADSFLYQIHFNQCSVDEFIIV
jgi:hypothetical protein